MKCALVTLLLLTSSCSLRVFQDKVPQPIQKNNSHIEAEKEAGFYLANNIETPIEAKLLANLLSSSLGIPTNTNNNNKEIKNNLVSNIADYNKAKNELDLKLSKLAGKEIEGTGFDIMSFMSVTSIILIIALCVFCPAIISVAFFIIKRLRGALVQVISSIETFKDNEPQIARKLTSCLSSNLDQSHKKLVSKLRHD